MELAQVAQHADDLDRAAAFYTELLGSGPSGRFDPPGFTGIPQTHSHQPVSFFDYS